VTTFPDSTEALALQERLLPPESPDQAALLRLRLAAGVSLIAELILPIFETVRMAQPDWLAIETQGIWFVLTIALLAGTWHPRFPRVWKPVLLLFSAALIISSGTLAIKGASIAPFLFLLVLLPVGGTTLPWETRWQAGMSAICVVLGLLFASQLGWQNGLLISGLSAMIASIFGSHLVNLALIRQRESIGNYLKALTRSEAKFRKIFETSVSLITIYTIPEGRIIDVNPAWEKTFGYTREEALGKGPAELGLTAEHDVFVQWITAVKMGDSGAIQDPAVFHGRMRNAVYCVYSWSTFELNERACVLVVGQDITGRVRAEDELRRNRESMLNQERLKAVGELASGIAHDLNNSLNALRLNVELLHEDSNLSSAQGDRLSLISRIVSDANSTIGRLQDFARRRHDRPAESVDLRAIIRQSVEMARSTLEEKTSFLGRSAHVEISLPGLPPILGEPAELRQIFVNLLLNAQDAMPHGGTIRMGAQVRDDTIVVTVEDEGQGIPTEYLARVFDPFFTTKGERGTGLGLSIAYGAMARLGGSITAGNRAGGGAAFSLSFPIAPPASGRAGGYAEVGRKVAPRRVMVIDDDQDNLDALAALFESRGHSVKAANSGPGALKELMRADCPIDVVFCDLGMPGINGWDIARQVKSLAAPPVFYLVTGWAQEIRADDPRRSLVDAIVAKPVEPQLLDRLLAGA
jgi:PAS domain S-box-containing protein